MTLKSFLSQINSTCFVGLCRYADREYAEWPKCARLWSLSLQNLGIDFPIESVQCHTASERLSYTVVIDNQYASECSKLGSEAGRLFACYWDGWDPVNRKKIGMDSKERQEALFGIISFFRDDMEETLKEQSEN